MMNSLPCPPTLRGWIIGLAALICLLSINIPLAFAADDPFPRFDAIESNVQFWRLVYSHYPSSEGILHDANDLRIIYTTIPLEPYGKSGAIRINRQRVRDAKSGIATILRKLAFGAPAESEEEKRIAGLWGDRLTDPSVLQEALDNIRLQRGQKDRFAEGLTRSAAYLEEFRRIFRRHGLPEDLVYLAHVESSFHLKAYSRLGAAGIWQFMYRTGKQYMTVDYTVDERWDPYIATDAAARLLKDNYRRLDCWPLALTAYNHGARAMELAKQELGSYEKIFMTYDGRRFRFASRNFYPGFLAAREIAKQHADYFPNLRFDTPTETLSLRLAGYASISDLADHFGVGIVELRRLNPSLREPVFREQKFVPLGFNLRLPKRADIPAKIAAIPESIYHREQKRSQFYWVQKGDVAGAVARKHGITLEELIQANNLDRRATIYVGQNLRIPLPQERGAMIATAEASSTKEVGEASSVATAQLSGMDNDSLDVPLDISSEEITILPSTVNPAVVSGDFRIKREYAIDGRPHGAIVVQTGETLGHYAEWLNVTAQTIRRLNQLLFNADIRLNQRLTVPLTRVSRAAFEEKRYEYHQEFEEDFLKAYRIEGVIQYEIRRGDNIWRLSTEKFRLPVWLVSKYNGDISLDRLMPGQKIQIPIVIAEGE
jgi:membrane-bound lytic murein transglycosylase D